MQRCHLSEAIKGVQLQPLLLQRYRTTFFSMATTRCSTYPAWRS